MAVRTAVEDRLVDPEAGLAPEVQIPDDLHGLLHFELGLLFATTVVTVAADWPGPGNFKAVAVPVALVSRDSDAFWQIDINGDGSHGRPR
jgi:hypothetical protein